MAIRALLKRKESEELWKQAAEHPFVHQLTKGTLSHDKFEDYIMQDKICCGGFRSFICNILADCPDPDDFESLNKLVAQLQGYGHEANLFKEMFDLMNISQPDMAAHPSTEAFVQFLWKVGVSGTLADKLIVLHAVVASYMEWAELAKAESRIPSDKAYAKWLEIHTAASIGQVVEWIKNRLDSIVGKNGESLTEHHHSLFQRALQHEILFWDASFKLGSSAFPGESRHASPQVRR